MRQARDLSGGGRDRSRVRTPAGEGVKLVKLLAVADVAWIVAEHRDRLARSNTVKPHPRRPAALSSCLNADEVVDGLVRGITEVLTGMGARLYGRRSAKKRARNGIAACAAGPQ